MKKPEKGRDAESEPQILLWEGEPVLSFHPPVVVLPAGMPRRVLRYYRRLEGNWLRRWEGEVYHRACTAAAEARAGSRPFTPWTAALKAEAELLEGEKRLCVRWQVEEMLGGRRGILYQGDVWQLPRGEPVVLKEFFPRRTPWKQQVMAQAEEQIRRRLAAGEFCCWQEWPVLLKRTFDPDHYFQTEEGPVLFFPLCAITPYFEGIPTFPLQIPTEG